MTDSNKRIVEGDIYRLRRFRISNSHFQIENLDGTDPRYIGIRGAFLEIVSTVGPSQAKEVTSMIYFSAMTPLDIFQFLMF
jgi:hypothetical protein